jgi:hypothetical protein
MGKEDVYIINAEDILESYSQAAGTRQGPRLVGEEGDRTAARTRRASGNARAVVASTLSLFLCGAGQAYNGQPKLGFFLFLTEVLAVVGHWSVIKLWPMLRDVGYIFAVTEWEIFVFLAISDFLMVFFLLYNVAQAYHQAELDGNAFDGLRRPILAGIASLLLPGWGQLLNAQLGKALFFLFCLLTEVYVVTLLLLLPSFRFLAELDLGRLFAGRETRIAMGIVCFAALTWAMSAYDAYLVARYRRVR